MDDVVSKVKEPAGSSITIAGISKDESERNPIFDALVSADGEVSGLVAYSIYKQNKRAWLDDFIKMTGRTPTDAETRAYIIGESTERRLATYRQLASLTLGGKPSGGASGMSGVGLPKGLVAALWAIVALVGLALVGYLLKSANLLGK